VACRVVRRLSNFGNQGAEVLYVCPFFTKSFVIEVRNSSSGSHASTGQYKANPVTIAPSAGRHTGISRNATRSGVHVQMETFTRTEEFDPASPTQMNYLKYSPTEVQLESGLKHDRDSDAEYEESKIDAI
jgi:hypothetical protein